MGPAAPAYIVLYTSSGGGGGGGGGRHVGPYRPPIGGRATFNVSYDEFSSVLTQIDVLIKN